MRLLDESSDEEGDIDADAVEPETDSDSKEQVRYLSTEPEVILAPSMDTYGFENLADEAMAECDRCLTCNNPYVAPGFPHCFTCQGSVEVEASGGSAEVQRGGEDALPSTASTVEVAVVAGVEVSCNAYGGLDQKDATQLSSHVEESAAVKEGTVNFDAIRGFDRSTRATDCAVVDQKEAMVDAPVPVACFWQRVEQTVLLGAGRRAQQQSDPTKGTACGRAVDDWVHEEAPHSLVLAVTGRRHHRH
jgi:hypothetical protein